VKWKYKKTKRKHCIVEIFIEYSYALRDLM